MAKKKRAIERAAETKDADRLCSDKLPLFTDTTEYVTPEIAEIWLKENRNNRTINWNQVEKIKQQMIDGEWKLHAQGIIFDNAGNLLTGQKRLWAVVLAGIPQYFRVSRGSPPDTADLIDRGISQTSRDLASRTTHRKHSPTEEGLAKEVLALHKVGKPTVDEIANIMKSYADEFQVALKATRGTKKTKGVLMIIAAICYGNEDDEIGVDSFVMVPELAVALEKEAHPILLKDCWRRPAAHFMVMEKAMKLLKNGFKHEAKTPNRV